MLEQDSCGVGFIANIKNVKSNKIIKLGIEAVKNLTHRGAIGADGKTGDGAGISFEIPRKFFKKEIDKLGLSLSSIDNLGVGVLFLYDKALESEIQKVAQTLNINIIGFRDVPTNDNALGESALKTKPIIKHMIIDLENINQEEREIKLYIFRKKLKTNKALKNKLYIPSLSSKTIVYKGMFLGTFIDEFYEDLKDEDIESSFCIFHQRYSTNTFPQWNLAQPFRYLAHNGEINTVTGNRNWMKALEKELYHEKLQDFKDILHPLVLEEESDSASLDKVLELLTLTAYPIEHAINMLIPPAFENDDHLDKDIKDFFEYKSLLMKPWDGPAAIVFTDGEKIGAHLDRNGLRPARYIITNDDNIVLGSEVGMVDIPIENIKTSGRLGPGDTILVEKGRVLFTEEILKNISKTKPYQEWIRENLYILDEHIKDKSIKKPTYSKDELLRKQIVAGYTEEEIKNIIISTAKDGKEFTFSMGDDTPLPFLSEKPVLLFRYFKQRFAQVTNPPIDSIRERSVMSLRMNMGYKRNFLVETKEHAKRLQIKSPILLDYEFEAIKNNKEFRVEIIDITYPYHRSDSITELQNESSHERITEILMDAVYEGIPIIDLKIAVERVQRQAERAILEGATILILSDRNLSKERVAIPSLLAVGAVNSYLMKKNLINRASIVVESLEPRDTHQIACLIGYGASAVYPYLLYETLDDLISSKALDIPYEKAVLNYKKSLEDGLLKIMAKMGIATLNSYQGAKIFDSIGLNKDFVEEYFSKTPVTLECDGIKEIENSVLTRHNKAFYEEKPELDFGGDLKFRKNGEWHAWSPFVVRTLHKFLKTLDYNDYKEFSKIANESHPTFIRNLLDFKPLGDPIPIEEVEPEESIVKRFFTGAMSLGALSPEAHETLAIAANSIGAKSNSGEGGEDPNRYFTEKNSAIKQVASGRFGVTPTYLASAKEIEIKIAQGAKPGEGGQLPGHKVSAYIAKIRHTQEGTTLISPPPHHDIYSIEDLAQLINDLKKANPEAKICVKLVSEYGVGTVASGVAKAYADLIQISGAEGGTGASPYISIKNTGNYWEIGLPETVKALSENGLRDRVRIKVDGGFRTGKDIILAALMGAEEYGFGTAALIAEGCVMARQCHLNTCPTGVTTQDEKLRQKFIGTKEGVSAYLMAIAREVREHLAQMGARSLNEIIGRFDLLIKKDIEHEGGKRVNLEPILGIRLEGPRICTKERNDNEETTLNDIVAKELESFIKQKQKVTKNYKITNIDRSFGATISYYISIYHKDEGLPEDTIEIFLDGVAGQSFGAFNHKGLSLYLNGLANDYVGKGMYGGKIIIKNKHLQGEVLAGNTVLYGATGGELYISGKVGERFCVRNSGAIAVVEGAGLHPLEYMTGGIAVILGQVGYNVGAGMTGGKAYIFDEKEELKTLINKSYVDILPLIEDEEKELLDILKKHIAYTNSKKALFILENFDNLKKYFKVVLPLEKCSRDRFGVSDVCEAKI